MLNDVAGSVTFSTASPEPVTSVTCAQCVQGLQTNKDSRLLWAKDDCIVATGFNQHRQQEVRLWDSRKLNSALGSVSLATSNG
ncbi:hypothetical protein NFI96_018274 [Prochilodus magdalenae]|nr:hypothetical protein NFI96_018274 [Prochilodus magdalenae]